MNPVTGAATNLTGTAPVPGLASSITTSGGQAAWIFDDGTRQIINNQTQIIYKLHFYDGSNLSVIDSGSGLASPQLGQGNLVYLKAVNGLRQVWFYNSTAANPAPVQLTANTSGVNFIPRTDGRHIAWLHWNPGASSSELILNGGLPLPLDSSVQPANPEFIENALQLQRGQVSAGDGQVTLSWDRILGASSYNLYLAQRSDLAPENYQSLHTPDMFGGAQSKIFRSTNIFVKHLRSSCSLMPGEWSGKSSSWK